MQMFIYAMISCHLRRLISPALELGQCLALSNFVEMSRVGEETTLRINGVGEPLDLFGLSLVGLRRSLRRCRLGQILGHGFPQPVAILPPFDIGGVSAVPYEDNWPIVSQW